MSESTFFGIIISLLLLCLVLLFHDARSTDTQESNMQATCIEHVTIDGKPECSIFELNGETYATNFAPMTRLETL